MNKTIISIMVCVLLCGSCFAAELNLFAKAGINKDSINVTFRNEGIRYGIILNGKNLGISNYGQNLVFKKTDTLILCDKEYSYMITYILKNNKDYLKIEGTGINCKTGKDIKEEYFMVLKTEK